MHYKMVVVSNRSPYVLSGGRWQRAVSGLVSCVEPLLKTCGGTWVAWGGRAEGAPAPVQPPGGSYHVRDVFLSAEEMAGYYDGFANQCLWPLCHSFVEKCSIRADHWDVYRRVNEKFARAAAEVADGEGLVWVHDYHLALVPRLLRRLNASGRIALFWHIPFPGPDIFRLLPWGRELLSGMLAANLIAFHTDSYVENFIDCVRAFFHAPGKPESDLLIFDGRPVSVRAIPVGVDWQHFDELAKDAAVQARGREIRRVAGAEYVLLGVDRLDYTKGILERLAAYELFLERHPEFVGRVTLIQIGVPTRNGVKAYSRLRRTVEEMVGRINGRFDRLHRAVPVRYLSRPLDERELVAHYLAADVALVTALRDGLNLVAKEFVAARRDQGGVLVLSRFAGAAEDLAAALLVNPYEQEELAGAIHQALTMPAGERLRRMQSLRRAVREKDLHWWWQNTLKYALPARLEMFSPRSRLHSGRQDGMAVNG